MRNHLTQLPSLGEAAREYHLPSEQARKQAMQQKELAATLQAQGQKGVGLQEKQTHLEKGTLVPTTYHINEKGEQVNDAAIERDPRPYQHIFDKAKQTALQIQLDYEDITDEECFFIYLFAIQQTINTHLTDQEHAETHIDELTTEKVAQGENILSIEDIKQREAEVCTTKSMIAKHFFQEHYPQVTTTMISEAQYKGGKNGHNYLQLDHDGKRYEYHANSPHANGLPHLIGLSESHQVIMNELREQQQGQQAIRRELWPKQERRAA